eukprot:COSAG04_NODE_21353_length_375_cov_0.771739_1_plen_50_part_01
MTTPAPLDCATTGECCSNSVAVPADAPQCETWISAFGSDHSAGTEQSAES